MSRRALDVLNAMPEQHRFIRGMVSWIGMRQVPLLYHRKERFTGETKYPLGKMMRLAIDAITGFSTRPLKIASYMGMLFGLLGLLGMVYTFYGWLADRALPGWTSVMSIVLILGSAQLLVLGVFGEYLGRLYVESKRRPLFVIDHVIGRSDALGAAAGADATHVRYTRAGA
jgi:dolichol-phosphate mannosyltransferase